MRPFTPNKTANQTDESTDTYDTIEWLLKNIPNNNGRAGLWGISYPAFQTVMGMIDAHPALKAASPQASPADMFIGDDFHHNGAFRLTYTFSWLAGNARIRKGPSETGTERFNPGTPDGYKFFLDLGPIASVNKKYFLNQVPEWNSYMEHPDYDEYWRRQNFLPYLKEITVPVLNVAGWFDAEDFYGPLAIYQQIEKTTPNNKSILVAGPFSHGGWNSHPDGNSLGDIRFRGEPAVYFRQQIQFPFFRYYLKDKGELRLPEALMYETENRINGDRIRPGLRVTRQLKSGSTSAQAASSLSPRQRKITRRDLIPTLATRRSLYLSQARLALRKGTCGWLRISASPRSERTCLFMKPTS